MLDLCPAPQRCQGVCAQAWLARSAIKIRVLPTHKQSMPQIDALSCGQESCNLRKLLLDGHAGVDSGILVDGRKLDSLTLMRSLMVRNLTVVDGSRYGQKAWLGALTTANSTDRAKAVFASSTIRFMLRGLKEKVPCAFLDMCTSTGCNPARADPVRANMQTSSEGKPPTAHWRPPTGLLLL